MTNTTQHASVADDAVLESLLMDAVCNHKSPRGYLMLAYRHIDTLLAAAREESAQDKTEYANQMIRQAQALRERAEKAEAALAETNRKNLELTRVNHEQRLQEKRLEQALAEARKSYKQPYKQAFSQFANSEDGLLAAAKPPAQAAARQEMPIRWQLVPKEPTPKMVDATFNDDLRAMSHNKRNKHIYRAMLAAAPAAPKQEGK